HDDKTETVTNLEEPQSSVQRCWQDKMYRVICNSLSWIRYCFCYCIVEHDDKTETVINLEEPQSSVQRCWQEHDDKTETVTNLEEPQSSVQRC
ncbi:hypothetical protein J6590_091978, partial [Homalodisca vitripennis]